MNVVIKPTGVHVFSLFYLVVIQPLLLFFHLFLWFSYQFLLIYLAALFPSLLFLQFLELC